jgi:hypothetical protein
LVNLRQVCLYNSTIRDEHHFLLPVEIWQTLAYLISTLQKTHGLLFGCCKRREKIKKQASLTKTFPWAGVISCSSWNISGKFPWEYIPLGTLQDFLEIEQTNTHVRHK